MVHLAVLFGDRLFDGQVGGDRRAQRSTRRDRGQWARTVGSVDPADVTGLTPTCEVDRVGLGLDSGPID